MCFLTMDLLELEFKTNPMENVLPCDGVVNYHGPILTAAEHGLYFDALLSDVPWQHDELVMFGKRITTARKVAWYGDEGYAYAYSGATKHALPWSDTLLELKAKVEEHSRTSFNSCLLNLYHSGDEGMSWHSDDEDSLGTDPVIASLSLGAARKFSFKHKRKDKAEGVSVTLEEGSLLVMREGSQTHWLHSLPKTRKVNEPRINLTFRTMVTI